MSDPITVKVIRVPGAAKEIGLEAGSTVQDALDTAGMSLSESEVIKLNGTNAEPDDQVDDGDKLIISKGAKGNR